MRSALLMLSLILVSLFSLVYSSSPQTVISAYGTISGSNQVVFFPPEGRRAFESFPFSLGSRQSGYDWDWVNGFQMDSNGNLYAYGDYGGNPNIYIRQSSVHVRTATYSAEFHIDANPNGQHCKLYESNQDRYPASYWGEPQPGAYYSAWYWFPSNFLGTFGTGYYNWRLLMQWGDAMSGPLGHFPTLYLEFEGSPPDAMRLKLDNENWWRGSSQPYATRWDTGYTAASIPKEQWVHIVVYVKMASGFQRTDGLATVWINEQKVVDASIALWNYYSASAGAKGVCWGIGNYGTSSSPSSIWVDDVQVTSAAP